MDFIEGEIICLNKPYGMSSFGALARARTILSRRLGVKRLKTGHAGTLDPLATGVLVICTGKKTKQIEEIQSHTKEYIAELQFGSTTPSFDLETPPDATYPTEHITRPLIETVLQRFVGRIEQVPPSYSACKIDGKRAYDLVRAGKTVELKPKILVIDEIELLSFVPEDMKAQIRVVCSKGTYIRALARDIGQALNSGAHLTALRRTRVGDITQDQSIKMEDFERWLSRTGTQQ